MPAPVLYPVNRLETSTVTTTGEVAAFPRTRLYERDITLLYKDAATAGLREIPRVDQGTSPLSYDTLILGPGHNLAGVPTVLDAGSDGASFGTTLASFTPTDATARREVFAATSLRYGRLRVTDPASTAQLTEVWLSKAVALSRAPRKPGVETAVDGNVEILESRAGYAWGIQRGVNRWRATYPFLLPDADRLALLQAHADVGGTAKLFWMLDADGVLRWVQWLDPTLTFRFEPVNAAGAPWWSTTLHFREAL